MFEIWNLKRRRAAVRKFYETERGKLTEGKDSLEQFNKLDAREFHEVREIEAELDMIQSITLLDEARELDVATPALTAMEMWSGDMDRIWLSSQGRATVRKAIDEENARRFEVKTRWVIKLVLPLFAALVGVIGAITGLVAVFYHRN